MIDSAETVSATSHPRFRRRKYLIDRRGQLLATAKIAGVVAVLLVLLNLVYSLWSSTETREIVVSNPQLSEKMEAIDRRGALALATVSISVFAAVVARSIMLTHRTAGAAFNICRCLDSVASGSFETTLRLRKKDTLRNLEAPFNTMVQSLRSRAADDRDALSALATQIEALGHTDLADTVRKLAEDKGQLVDPPA
jgi:methyl-accepting chemotaxis protein